MLRWIFFQYAVDCSFRVSPQITHARFAAQIIVHRFLDVRFSIYVALIERELSRFFLVGVVRCADVAENVRRQRAVNVGAHRFDRDVHTRKSDIVLGEFRHRREIDVLDVGIRDFGVVAVMPLELFRIVIARQIEIVQSRDDSVIHDLDNVRFLHVLWHAADDGAMLGQRRRAKAFAIALHHFRKVKIHFVTGTVLHQRQTVPIFDLAADRWNSDRRL